MGRPLISALLSGGHSVRALARPGSEHRLPSGATAVRGDALDAATFAAAIAPADSLVHLVGTAHPNPSKAREFVDVDLASIRASVSASRSAGIDHLIYVSVAQPAPVMRAYVAARKEGEAACRASAISVTILRPWYVLGPGHRWPMLLKPLYALLESFKATRESARRLGLVTLDQMVVALVYAVEHPASALRIVEVPEIRA